MKLMRGFSGGLDAEIKNSPDLRITQVNVDISKQEVGVTEEGKSIGAMWQASR